MIKYILSSILLFNICLFNNRKGLNNISKKISVIVECNNVLPIVQALATQTYTNYEVILLNEASENYKLENVINAQDLKSAYEKASGEIILYIDSECSFENDLLQRLNSLYVEGISAVILRFLPSQNSIFSKVQFVFENLLLDLSNISPKLYVKEGSGISYLKDKNLPSKDLSCLHDGKVLVSNIVLKDNRSSVIEVVSKHSKVIKAQSYILSSALFLVNLTTPFFYYYFGFNTFLKVLGDYMFVSSLNKNSNLTLSLLDEILVTLIFPFYYIYVYFFAMIT